MLALTYFVDGEQLFGLLKVLLMIAGLVGAVALTAVTAPLLVVVVAPLVTTVKVLGAMAVTGFLCKLSLKLY